MNKSRVNRTSSARALAFAILLQFEQTRPRLDDLLEEVWRKADLSEQDRRLLRNLSSGPIRHLLYLDWIMARLYKGRFKKLLVKTKIILRLALYELIFMPGIPPRATLFEYGELSKRLVGGRAQPLVNGILRQFLRSKEALQPQDLIKNDEERISISYSFPLWLVKRWVKFWGVESTEALCRSLNEPPLFDLRIIRSRINGKRFKELLEENNISFRPSPYFEDVVTVNDIQAIRRAGLFEKGYCLVQDESAHIPVDILSVGKEDLVLDVCAAPGGKFTQILEQGKSALSIALDIDLRRLQKVKQNVRRLKLQKAAFVCADARYLPFREKVFDKILLDAPCSGLGTIRKHPDIKWRRDLAQLVEFSKLQQDLLTQAFRLLKEKGFLAYSTCTMDYLENENVTENFRRRFGEKVEAVPIQQKAAFNVSGNRLRTFPHLHHTDGSFVELFQKKIAGLDKR